jgi:murein L,D-transpeptidase YafK
MKKLILIFTILINLLATTNYVEIYRKSGIDDVQKKLNQALMSEEYWLKYLNDFDTKYGYYEFDRNIIIVDKNSKSFKLFNYKDKKLTKIFDKSIITGKAGQKSKEGDLITPIGTYDITSNFTPQDSFYGPTAFGLSYPNLLDKLSHRDGHGIWIHGHPLDNSPRDDYSKGCLVLKNDEIIELKTLINYRKTIVLITQNSKPTVSKDELAKLLAFLYSWKDSWTKTDFKRYISHYADDFKRYDGKNLKQFKRYKRRVFRNKSKKTILFDNISIFPYPNQERKKIFKITFDETYRSSTHRFNGYKKIFVEINNSNPKIIIEQ